MKYVKVKLIRAWGDNDYYKAGNIVIVSEDVGKMMAFEPNKYGDIIYNDNDQILDNFYISGDEEE